MNLLALIRPASVTVHMCYNHPNRTAAYILHLSLRQKYLCDLCGKWAQSVGSHVEKLETQ